MTPLIGYCERCKNAVEFYGFWGPSDRTTSFTQIYLNYSSLLKAFIHYFKEKCRAILQSDTVPYLSLCDLIGNSFITSAIQKNKNDLDKIYKYLKEIGCTDELKKAGLLSPRERECVKLLLKGKSAKESGRILDLSFRTVEHYIENIKHKFQCRYKDEIFSIGESLNELGLL